VKISRILFKPRWQDKDAATRLAAVGADNDPELIAALPDLTRSDPDARVRLAALKRLGDYECWRERSTADSDSDVRRTARATYLSMLCAGAPGSPALPRLIAELDTLSTAEVETVATAATNRALRAAALALVTRPALLVERAGADPDPALRLAALERINDPAALERIAERTRKTDKTINRAARERLQALRIEGGDAGAIATRARTLCERMETLLRDPDADGERIRRVIEAEWAQLGKSVPDELVTRFRGASALLQRAPTPPKSEPAAEATAPIAQQDALPPEPATAQPERDEGVSEARAAEELASRARFDAALAAAAERTKHEREQRDATLRRIEEHVPLLATALDAGDTAAAHMEDARITSLLEALGATPRGIEQRLAPLHARLAELRRWQHWSNQRRRRALCTEIEALAQSGLHPDAVATRVHEARIEWTRLDAMEGLERAGESSGMARHFFAACQRALKPAHAYFAKRDSVRDAQRQQIEDLLQRHAALAPESDDWKAIAQLRHELAACLRSLDALNPRDRNMFARRIKDAIGALAPRLEQHFNEIEAAKARLIEQARALAQKADRGSPRAARELQQQWSTLGAGSRSTDQKQWREFRKACDQIFAALDNERKQREADAAAHGERARAIAAEAEAFLGDAEAAVETLRARRRELEARWRECANTDRALERRFNQALDALAARAEQQVRAGRLGRYTQALDAYARVRARESGSAAPAGEDDGGTGALAAEFSALAARWSRAADAAEAVADEQTLDEARDTLVRLEFLGGVPSPAEDAGRRMNYQVSRLSARMRGTSALTAAQELTALMAEWFALPGRLPEELDARFERAARAAIATLP
jgi:hypothetical protein